VKTPFFKPFGDSLWVGSRFCANATLATMRLSRRWGTEICDGLDLGHPPVLILTTVPSRGLAKVLDYTGPLTKRRI
jgi:hypothetical protein